MASTFTSQPKSFNCCNSNVTLNYSLPVDQHGHPLPHSYDTLLALLPAPLLERLRQSLSNGQTAVPPSGPVKYTQHEQKKLTRNLRGRRVVFIIDDSPESLRKWSSVKTAFQNLAAEVLKFGPLSVDVHFTNRFENINAPGAVISLSWFNFGDVLQEFDIIEANVAAGLFKSDFSVHEALRQFTSRIQQNDNTPALYTVITAAKPIGIYEESLKEVIVQTVQSLDSKGLLYVKQGSRQVGFQFVVVGGDIPTVEYYKRLDNLRDQEGSNKVPEDIVDMAEWPQRDGALVTKSLLGCIDKSFDGSDE